MVEECSDTRIHGLEAVSGDRETDAEEAAAPFGVEGDALGPRGLGLKLGYG